MRDESIVRDALEWGRNATEASAALDRIVADRDELKRQMKLIQDGKGRGTSNLTEKPGGERRVCSDCGVNDDWLMMDGSWICHQCGAVS